MFNKKPKVLVFTDCPSPYKVNFLNLLKNKVDLNIYLQKEKLNDRNEKWYENSNELNYTVLPKKILAKVFFLFKLDINEFDLFWNLKYLSLEGIILSCRFKLKNKPRLMHADGGIYRDRGFIVNKLMSIFMNLNSHFASSGILCDQYYEYYGVNKRKIYNYRFSSILEEDIQWKERLMNDKEIDELLSVGQIIYRKGYDILLHAIKDLNNVHLTIVGGNPTDELKKIINEYNLESKVTFVDFVQKKELQTYYRNADIFVLPTREDIWGLVINEAIAHGLPCISTLQCASLVEINRHKEVGLIYDCEDFNALSECISKLISNDELYRRYNSNTKDVAKSFTIENTVLDYIIIFEKVLGGN